MKNGQTFSPVEIKEIFKTANIDLKHVFVTNEAINGGFLDMTRDELIEEVKDGDEWFYREAFFCDSVPEGGSTEGKNRKLVLDNKGRGLYVEVYISA